MFKQVLYPDWATVCPILATLIFFGIFIWVVIRVIRMPSGKIHHLENMPLDLKESREGEDIEESKSEK